MLTLIIIICITVFIISAIRGNKKNANKQQAAKSTLLKNTYEIYRRKRDLQNLRYEQREERKRRVWSVLFIANSIRHCQEEYPSKKDWQTLDQAISAVKEYKPQYRDIMVAIRYCKIEYAIGSCDKNLSKQDLFTLRNIRQLIAANQLPVSRPISNNN